jgi:hypothetical protein
VKSRNLSEFFVQRQFAGVLLAWRKKPLLEEARQYSIYKACLEEQVLARFFGQVDAR